MLSGKTKLCIKVLVAMASAPPHRPVTVNALAERLQVSVSHLESVASTLRNAGFVRSARGPGGGYYLDCDATRTSVWEVVRRIDPKCREPAVPVAKASAIASLEDAILATFIDHLSARMIGEFADTSHWPPAPVTPMGTRFRLRPLPKLRSPSAPNSVFQLSAFPHLSAA